MFPLKSSVLEIFLHTPPFSFNQRMFPNLKSFPHSLIIFLHRKCSAGIIPERVYSERINPKLPPIGYELE